MKRLGAILVLALAALAAGAGPAPRFVPVDIVLDSPEPVAAWQFELSDRNGAIKVVGIENGDSAVFERAPRTTTGRQPRRVPMERIVVADYTLADVADLLPRGQHDALPRCMRSSTARPSFMELTLVDRDHRRRSQPIDASISACARYRWSTWRNPWTRRTGRVSRGCLGRVRALVGVLGGVGRVPVSSDARADAPATVEPEADGGPSARASAAGRGPGSASDRRPDGAGAPTR